MKLQVKAVVVWAILVLLSGTLTAQSESLESGVSGLIEPNRTINLSASESGVLTELAVVEGQPVAAGDVIAKLDDQLQATQLKIAHQRMVSQGDLQLAEAEWNLRRTRLERLQLLLQEGHARPEEVRRAAADLEIAAARLASQRDEHAVRELEHLRAEQTLARRTIRSPIDGVVSRLDRQQGEFLSPVRPEVAQIIETNPVVGVFAVPLNDVGQLTPDSRVSVTVNGAPHTGLVESVGVTIDSASQTVKVRVRLRNDDGQLVVGQPCLLRGVAGDAEADDRFGAAPAGSAAAASASRQHGSGRGQAFPTPAFPTP